MSKGQLYSLLLSGTAIAALLAAGPALAQASAPAAQSQALEEVVVTATRQADTVNRVSLSVAAVTQKTLDAQGVKQAVDIVRLVPGLSIAGGNSTPGIGTFAIRGIVGGTGAATTGVYLDDVSLTKRANNGVQQNNGAPLPALFDLERVEVLKGPQGTLYGGSSEGGTVRFITPTPSLTTYSGMMRVEGKTVDMGGSGYEVGAAVGGPIVQDKLGFRISGLYRLTPGWINAVSPYTGQTLFKNVNENSDTGLRASVLWKPLDRMTVLVSAYNSKTWIESGIGAPTQVYSPSANGQRAAPGATFTTPALCYNTSTFRTVPVRIYDPTIPYPNAPLGTAQTPTLLTPAQAPGGICPTGQPGLFQRPSYTYGPFNLAKNASLLTTQQSLYPSQTELGVYSATIGYDFDQVSVKLISSNVQDHTRAGGAGGEDQTQQQWLTTTPTNAATGAPAYKGFSLWSPSPDYPGLFRSNSNRMGWEEELRLSSPANAKPLSWVAGVFFSDQRIHQVYYYDDLAGKLNTSELSFWGITSQQRYGVQNICDCNSYLEAHLKDRETAFYGEANYWILPKLKATAGLRYSILELTYDQLAYGVFSSRYPNAPGSLSSVASTDRPLTPKFALTYELTDSDLVYISATKGFRAGGGNAQVTQSVCQTGLDQFGITANDIPKAFHPDTVWSYEAGGKFRMLDNRLQINGAIYQIDWSGIQATLTIPGCGLTFVQNGGRAQSRGFDLQTAFRPIPPLNLGFNVSYTDAKYIDSVAGPRGPVAGVPPSINAGDHFPVPLWQLSANAQYDFTLFQQNLFIRGDYQFQGGYTNPGSYGVSVYNPYTRYVKGWDVLSLRGGINFKNWDMNLYANNVLNEWEPLGNAGNGTSGCAGPTSAAGNPACTTFTVYSPFVGQAYVRPREIGIQANYRF
jgi:outer membrane receptor protein involved in Fe transport